MIFEEEPSATVAAKLASEICYTNKNSLSAGLIVAGYHDIEGAQVYSIPLGGSLHKQKLAVSGSGSSVSFVYFNAANFKYIMGFLDRNFQENMEKTEAIEFLMAAIALAMERDGSSG